MNGTNPAVFTLITYAICVTASPENNCLFFFVIYWWKCLWQKITFGSIKQCTYAQGYMVPKVQNTIQQGVWNRKFFYVKLLRLCTRSVLSHRCNVFVKPRRIFYVPETWFCKVDYFDTHREKVIITMHLHYHQLRMVKISSLILLSVR